MIEKTPAMSELELVYDFSGDGVMRDAYQDCWRSVRLGILFEDLDAIAGNGTQISSTFTITFLSACSPPPHLRLPVAFMHSDDGNPETRPPMLVTAKIDSFAIEGVIPTDEDIFMAAKVAHVGRSSMTIRCQVQTRAQRDDPAQPAALVADVLYVARDRRSGRATAINPLRPETAREWADFRELEAAAAAKKQKKKQEQQQGQNTVEAAAEAGAEVGAEAAAAAAAAATAAAAAAETAELEHVTARALLEEAQHLLRMPALARPFDGTPEVLVDSTILQVGGQWTAVRDSGAVPGRGLVVYLRVSTRACRP
jgi:acyl-CoA hydrolase